MAFHIYNICNSASTWSKPCKEYILATRTVSGHGCPEPSDHGDRGPRSNHPTITGLKVVIIYMHLLKKDKR